MVDESSSLQEDDGDQDCVIALLKINLDPIVRGVAAETGLQEKSVFWNACIALALAIDSVFPVEIFNGITAGINHGDYARRGALPCAIGEIHCLRSGGEPGKLTNSLTGHDDGISDVALPEG